MLVFCWMCRLACKYVLNTGENFPDLGIDMNQSVYDPQFAYNYNLVYTASSLQVPWVNVLGSNDYGSSSAPHSYNGAQVTPGSRSFSTRPQMTFSWTDRANRWKMPFRYFNMRPDPGSGLWATAMDSTPQIDGYCMDSTGSSYGPELLQNCKVRSEFLWC